MTIPVNPQAFQFRDQFYALVPGWLHTGNGERYMYTLQLCRDLLCEKAYQAMTIRLPGVGDYSNLPYLAFDRNLLQGPKEPNASFAGRLTGAFEAWGEAGSAAAVIGQLQAYLQGLQPGVDPTLPAITIVGGGGAYGGFTSHTTWNTVLQGTPIGAPPTLTTVFPANFNWDNDTATTWRNFLVLPMYLVPVPGLSGSAAMTSTSAPSACFTSPGQAVNGVWVPATSGTPVNSPWLTIVGLSGLTVPSPGNPGNVGQWLTVSDGMGHGACLPIVSVTSSSSCVVATPTDVPSGLGPFLWSIGQFPLFGPGPAWGAPGVIFGQGEKSAPPFTPESMGGPGTLIGGVWQPPVSAVSGVGTRPLTIAWGLTSHVGPAYEIIASLRSILKTWKSAGTYYPYMIIAFDCGTGAPGSAYSPSSTPGAGNPDGSFGSFGMNVDGVWVPTRIIPGNPMTPYLSDAYCQGTGIASNCSVENIT